MTEVYKAERTITTVLKEESQVDQLVRRLIDRGVPQDHISLMGQNFESKTRISGFISKKDVILGGLRTGGFSAPYLVLFSVSLLAWECYLFPLSVRW